VRANITSVSSVKESGEWQGTAAAAEQGCQMSCVRCRALQHGGEDGEFGDTALRAACGSWSWTMVYIYISPTRRPAE